MYSQECLGEMTTLQLKSPTEQLVAVGTQGTIESTLNITAGTEGGAVVWELEEVITSFSEEVSGGRGGGGKRGLGRFFIGVCLHGAVVTLQT